MASQGFFEAQLLEAAKRSGMFEPGLVLIDQWAECKQDMMNAVDKGPDPTVKSVIHLHGSHCKGGA